MGAFDQSRDTFAANLFSPDMDRRVFVRGLGLVSVGFVTTALLGGCESLLEQIENRPVRRRLRNGSPEVDEAVEIYAEAVSEMKMLANGNPRSWAAQAAIHGNDDMFNFCQHGTSHFFSWHRAYLYYFEKICQELTGEPDFGLPYWNWNQNHAMHSAFTAMGSTLNHPRNNTTVGANPAFSDMTMNTIFGDPNFFTFSSQLEGSPHNAVHNIVGEDMASGGSPLDPIFWPHHCMVDYSWAKWNIELDNDNTDDDSWYNTSWNHFVDGEGNPASVTAGSTVLMPLISYRYESSAVGGFGAGFNLVELSTQELEKIQTRLRRGADVRFDIKRRIPLAQGVSLPIDRPYSKRTELAPADITALLDVDTPRERVFLSLRYAQLPMESGFFVRVFVNLPEANAGTPTDDIHYAGSFSFFGTHGPVEHDEHRTKTDFLVNVTDTLQNLARAGTLRSDQPVSVQLVAVPAGERFVKPDMRLILLDLDFIISGIGVRSKQ
jgi:tyrosinase